MDNSQLVTLTQRVAVFNHSKILCDRCNLPCLGGNSAARMEAGFNAWVIPTADRHILPVIIDGNTVCIGSPSRAQHLSGQPKDTREEFASTEDNSHNVQYAFNHFARFPRHHQPVSEKPLKYKCPSCSVPFEMQIIASTTEGLIATLECGHCGHGAKLHPVLLPRDDTSNAQPISAYDFALLGGEAMITACSLFQRH